MSGSPYLLNEVPRYAVLAGLIEACSRRCWTLLAAHVRTNHVHAVVAANRSPEQVMNALKAYASRKLNELALDHADQRRWARHGSTRYLWTSEAVSAAVRYVVGKQGESMAVFEAAAL